MGTKRKKINKKTSSRRIIVVVAAITIITTVAIILLNIDYAYITDKQKADEYTPSDEMRPLIARLNLTERGRTILYASAPQLKGKVAFNGICGNDGDPNTYIAGCYYKINDDEYIDIYDSGKEASEIEHSYYSYDNSKTVTLAHEMMHAVYSRISDKDKEWIELELNKIYQSNSELREELTHYPSSERYDELYVRAATELYSIPSTLEKHYAVYFKDRIYIAKLYHSCKQQIQDMLAQADIILERMETQRSLFNNSTDYYTRRNAANEYNRLQEVYNSQIGVYRKIEDKLDSEK